MTGVDEFLAHADDVLMDWIGSADAASWAADGSHEDAHEYVRDEVRVLLDPTWHAVVDAAWEQMMARPGWAPVA